MIKWLDSENISETLGFNRSHPINLEKQSKETWVILDLLHVNNFWLNLLFSVIK